MTRTDRFVIVLAVSAWLTARRLRAAHIPRHVRRGRHSLEALRAAA